MKLDTLCAVKLDTLSLSGSLSRRGPGAAGGRARAGNEAPGPPPTPLPPLGRLDPGSLTLTSDDPAATGREGGRMAPVPLPPEIDAVEEPREALAAAAMAWASARVVCIVVKAPEIGTPGAWKHPFTNVPTAWSTTLSSQTREDTRKRAARKESRVISKSVGMCV